MHLAAEAAARTTSSGHACQPHQIFPGRRVNLQAAVERSWVVGAVDVQLGGRNLTQRDSLRTSHLLGHFLGCRCCPESLNGRSLTANGSKRKCGRDEPSIPHSEKEGNFQFYESVIEHAEPSGVGLAVARKRTEQRLHGGAAYAVLGREGRERLRPLILARVVARCACQPCASGGASTPHLAQS